MQDVRRFLAEKCMEQGLENIVKSLGYENLEKGLSRLNRVLSSPDLGLSVSEYDYVLGSEAFVQKLFITIGASDMINQSAIEDQLEKINDDRYGYRPWVFVDTGFKRQYEPVFVLAFLESRRRIRISKAFKKESRNMQLAHLKDWVLNFMKEIEADDGKVTIWGAPKQFVCHMAKDHIFTLDLEGDLIAETHEHIDHGGACVSIG